jgi:hypothetical protein
MRQQSIELLQIAKEFYQYVKELNRPPSKAESENGIRVLQISKDSLLHYKQNSHYANLEFSGSPNTVNVGLFEQNDFISNTITINIESVSDNALDLIIQIAKTEFETFKLLNPIKELNETCM